MSRVVRKPVFGAYNHFGHKLGCTATEDGRLKFWIKKVEGLFPWQQIGVTVGKTASSCFLENF